MSKYNILWVDDDIYNPELLPDWIALEQECNIIGFDNPDSFLDHINNKQNDFESIHCIIIDLSMPLGKGIKKDVSRGTAVGQILLEKVKKTKYKDVLTVVYTITDNNNVKEYCRIHNIPYLKKTDYLSNNFANTIVDLIVKNGKKI